MHRELDGADAAANTVIAVAADMTPGGSFGESWLIVTRDRLRVFDTDGGAPALRHDIALAELREPKADSLVGGGALQARIDGAVVDLVRYSNAHERRFSRVARYLSDVAKYHRAREKGEEAKEPALREEEGEPRRCPECGLLLHEGTQVCPACLKKHKVVLRLLGYMRPYWRAAVGVSALLLAGTGVGLIAPYLTRPLVDDVLVNTTNPAGERLVLLGVLVLALLIVRIAVQALGILQGRLNVWLGTRLGHRLRTEVYEHIQTHSLRFFDKHKTGALMTRVGQDTRALERALINGVPFFLANILTLVGITVILLMMNWKLTLLVFLPGPVVILLSRVFWKRMFRILHGFWHTRAKMHTSLNDSLSGARVIKAFGQEEQEISRFDGHSATLAGAMLRLEQFSATFFPLLSFITGLGLLIVWYVGGRQVIGGSMSLGTLLAFIAYLGTFYGPMRFLSHVGDWLARALTSAERIFEIIDSKPDVPEAEDAVPMPHIRGHVELRNVTFGYDAHKPVLKDISVDVQPGEMIGLVGKSGAGKSTTINIICRLYDVQEGSILIDGVDIRKVRQDDLRHQIGVVLQDTFLFNDTILENIRYAKPDATEEEVMAAAHAANAHDFIVEKPDGYDTVVGERGASLSGGERQRIAIARAILHDPRILILDEATSSVDTDTEKQIQNAIVRLVEGRTTFAIAHRLSTLRNADRLAVLKEGKVEEIGTHDELLEKKGEFHRLVTMQREMSQIMEIR